MAGHISKWNGSFWEYLGNFEMVTGIAELDADVYVSVSDRDKSGEYGWVMKWNGSSWDAFGPALNGAIFDIAAVDGNVYVGGKFTSVKHIAKWNGNYWGALGTGVDTWVNSIAVSSGNVYVGGKLDIAGHVEKWNGDSWEALGTKFNGSVRAIAVSGNDVYAGGHFTDAGHNENADYIAKWNGSSWEALGTGLNGDVYDIAVSGNDVYVGGDFSAAGGMPAAGFARWHVGITDVDEEDLIVHEYSLRQNFPNPFNPSTMINYQLPMNTHAKLSVYNLLGQEVRTLVNGHQPTGIHEVTWDGRDDAGRTVASGVYLYRLEAGGYVQSKKMVLIK
jgi:hypothetical protein